jgi:hypothetical protein
VSAGGETIATPEGSIMNDSTQNAPVGTPRGAAGGVMKYCVVEMPRPIEKVKSYAEIVASEGIRMIDLSGAQKIGPIDTLAVFPGAASRIEEILTAGERDR